MTWLIRRAGEAGISVPNFYRDDVVADGRWTGQVRWNIDEFLRTWDAIRRLRRPARIFLGNMSDLFHEATPPTAHHVLARIFGEDLPRIGALRRHTYLLVTKRPDRLLSWQRALLPDGLPSQVWCLASVCNQEDADRMIPDLLQVKASVRGVSVEPMLGPIDLQPFLTITWGIANEAGAPVLPALDWVICGGESGPGARPMDLDWVRSLRDQCQGAGVPFFYKQGPGPDGRLMSMPPLDGRTWEEVPRE
jgi:protein gp37